MASMEEETLAEATLVEVTLVGETSNVSLCFLSGLHVFVLCLYAVAYLLCIHKRR